MLNRVIKITPAIVALSFFTTGAVAETEMRVGQCLAGSGTSSVGTKDYPKPNYDPDCGDWYKKCDSSGVCYECTICTYGGPYCWRIN